MKSKPVLLSLFFLSVAILLFTLYYHNIIEFDQDLGRHLLTGQIIWQTHHVPGINLYSYTQTNFPFINTHWLSEVIFYLTSLTSFTPRSLGEVGPTSLLYLKILVMLSAGLLTLWTTYRFSKSLPATAVAFTVLVPVLLERTEIRPEIFSYLFTAIFLYILFRIYKPGTPASPPGGEYQPKFFILHLSFFIFMEVLWVNLHIYFILGPILVTIFSAAYIFHLYFSSRQPLISPLTTRLLLLVFLTYLATLINPHFLQGALYPFTVFNNYGYSIVENQSPFFLETLGVINPNILYFKVGLIVLVISILITNHHRLSPLLYALCSLLILPLLHIRSLPYLFFLGLPILAFNLAHLRPGVLKILSQLPLSRIAFTPRSLGGVGLITLISLISLIRVFRLATNDYYQSIDSHKRFGSTLAESYKPGVDFVLAHHLTGPIFNNFDIGSYLDYRFYWDQSLSPLLSPLSPFIDGRPEAYPKEFLQNLYIPSQMSAENFQKIADLYKLNLIIFSHTDATPWAEKFLGDIINNPKYSLVFLDPAVVVFIKNPSPLPTSNPQTVIPLPTTVVSYLDALSLARITSIFNWSNASEQYLRRAYSLNPNSTAIKTALRLTNQSSSRLILF